MTPRRLLPLLGVFLLLGGLWFGVAWWQERQDRDKVAAQKLFPVQEAQITAVALKRGAEDIRFVKEGQEWRLTHPLKDRADQRAVGALAAAIPALSQTRDLGAGQDLKTFGLDRPTLVLTFTAGEKTHTLTLGRKTPGEQSYYAQKDQDPRVLLISATGSRTLEQPLSTLRDRSLFDFSVDKVKSLKVKAGATQVVLEKTGATWRWPGHETFKVNSDRLERLLRYLSLIRVSEFPALSSPDLGPLGLAPPALEVVVVTDQGEQRLALGTRQKNACFARKGETGPVMLADDLLLDLLTAPLEDVAGLAKDPFWGGLKGKFPHFLEERRLWTGEVRAVASLTWGPPGQAWTGTKDQDFFKLTGPDKKEVRQPALRVEMALLQLRDLEAARLTAPGAPEAKVGNAVELQDAEGKPLFRLEEVGQAQEQVEVRFTLGTAPPQGARVPQAPYRQWLSGMERLTLPPPGK